MKKIILSIICLSLISNWVFGQKTRLTEHEKKDLRYLYEEERLANDVYNQLAKKWNSRVFAQIATSENRHYTYLLDFLEKYQESIPKNEVGFYNSMELNSIYDNFITNGFKSYKDALLVAAQFEEYDIVDLQEAMEMTDKQELKKVYVYLEEGSKRHLRALYRNIKRKRMNYEPILLGKKEFLEIINQEKNRKIK